MNKIKRVIVLFALILFLMSEVSIASNIKVYITNTGKKYHNHGCRYLRQSCIERDLEDVIGKYDPCSVCKPPTASSLSLVDEDTEESSDSYISSSYAYNAYKADTSKSVSNNYSTSIKEENKADFTGIYIMLGFLFGPSIIGGIYEKVRSVGKDNDNKSKQICYQEAKTNDDSFSKKSTVSQKNNAKTKRIYYCPKCGSELVIKNGRYGRFIGCSNYPYCTYTKSLKKY